MVSKERVQMAMYFRLDYDRREVLEPLGSEWVNRNFSDFYFNERQVDRAVWQAAKSALESQTDLPHDDWDELADRVSMNTKVSDAIELITNLSVHARPTRAFA